MKPPRTSYIYIEREYIYRYVLSIWTFQFGWAQEDRLINKFCAKKSPPLTTVSSKRQRWSKNVTFDPPLVWQVRAKPHHHDEKPKNFLLSANVLQPLENIFLEALNENPSLARPVQHSLAMLFRDTNVSCDAPMLTLPSTRLGLF